MTYASSRDNRLRGRDRETQPNGNGPALGARLAPGSSRHAGPRLSALGSPLSALGSRAPALRPLGPGTPPPLGGGTAAPLRDWTGSRFLRLNRSRCWTASPASTRESGCGYEIRRRSRTAGPVSRSRGPKESTTSPTLHVSCSPLPSSLGRRLDPRSSRVAMTRAPASAAGAASRARNARKSKFDAVTAARDHFPVPTRADRGRPQRRGNSTLDL